ncbi:hypothetical protein ACFWGM_29580, partial [Streptomyces roseolus]|uniref:hypothetical protein n=1 Tax=Streptomyces roseolus TaxID=67358 RepID=UPI0036515FFD
MLFTRETGPDGVTVQTVEGAAVAGGTARRHAAAAVATAASLPSGFFMMRVSSERVRTGPRPP